MLLFFYSLGVLTLKGLGECCDILRVNAQSVNEYK